MRHYSVKQFSAAFSARAHCIIRQISINVSTDDSEAGSTKEEPNSRTRSASEPTFQPSAIDKFFEQRLAISLLLKSDLVSTLCRAEDYLQEDYVIHWASLLM